MVAFKVSGTDGRDDHNYLTIEEVAARLLNVLPAAALGILPDTDLDLANSLNAALDQAATEGKNLLLRAGTYKSSKTLQVSHLSGLIGAGRGKTTIEAVGSDPAVVQVKRVSGGYPSDIEIGGFTLKGTSAQLYGLLVEGAQNSYFHDLRSTGLSALTGSGWDGSEAAWAFYFTSYDDDGSLRKFNNNIVERCVSDDAPNGMANASSDGSAASKGGNDNTFRDCGFAGFKSIGLLAFGESNSYSGFRNNSINTGVICGKFMDARTKVASCDFDSSAGSIIPVVEGPWGFDLGKRDQGNTGYYFADTSSGVCDVPAGNGCTTMFDFQSGTAYGKWKFNGSDRDKVTGPLNGWIRPSKSYTGSASAVFSDAGKFVRLNSTSAINLTIEPTSVVGWQAGMMFPVEQQNTGQATIVAGSGVTINRLSPKTLAIAGRRGVVWLYFTGVSETWESWGDFA